MHNSSSNKQERHFRFVLFLFNSAHNLIFGYLLVELVEFQSFMIIRIVYEIYHTLEKWFQKYKVYFYMDFVYTKFISCSFSLIIDTKVFFNSFQCAFNMVSY